MSPLGVTVTTNEQLQAGAGASVGAGRAFIAVRSDAGPPIGSAAYVKCQSINDYIIAFGQRSTASSKGYDWADTFFQEGGSLLYVTRDTDSTAVTATLTLQDAFPHPTVVVSGATPGTDANNTFIQVTLAASATFTGTLTNASTSVTAVSSFTNIGVGTPVSGTGIPAGTYVASVNTGASTLTLSAAATAPGTAVVITPSKFTVSVQDAAANVLETHGPFITTAQLYADTSSSAYVTFAQSAAGGFTVNVPAASGPTALSGGVDATDLSDTTAVTALANFPTSLGPGTVALPGVTTSTGWNGLLAHAKANNRFAAMDLADAASAPTLISAIGTIGANSNASYGIFAASSLIVPGLPTAPTVPRTVAASAAVAALRARVSATGNENQAPAGAKWPLTFVTGFTNTYNKADTLSLNSAGINTFQTPASGLGLAALCLCGFSTPVSPTVDAIFWQATATCERMALVAEGGAILLKYMFEPLDGQLLTITAAQNDLQAMIAAHWRNKALFGAAATDAGIVNVQAPINTPSTEQLGQLNANVVVRITPFVQSENLSITEIPITQAVV